MRGLNVRDIPAAIRAFHEDEEGLEALQVVMIIAIAAMILIAVKTMWTPVQTWFEEKVNSVTDKVTRSGSAPAK